MENLTVNELKEKCRSLNIKLTKSDGSSKLKADLIKSLSKVEGQILHYIILPSYKPCIISLI